MASRELDVRHVWEEYYETCALGAALSRPPRRHLAEHSAGVL